MASKHWMVSFELSGSFYGRIDDKRSMWIRQGKTVLLAENNNTLKDLITQTSLYTSISYALPISIFS